MTPVTGSIERLFRPKCEIKSVKSHNEKLILHDISHSVIITHSHYEQINYNMIAGITFARCHEARWHVTSATATARKHIVRQRRGVTLHESTHNGFLQIMHPRTFLIKNPSDAKLASLSVFRKWPVSMATIAKIGNY